MSVIIRSKANIPVGYIQHIVGHSPTLKYLLMKTDDIQVEKCEGGYIFTNVVNADLPTDYQGHIIELFVGYVKLNILSR